MESIYFIIAWATVGLATAAYGIYDSGRFTVFDIFLAVSCAILGPLVYVGLLMEEVFNCDDIVLWKKK